MINFCNELMTDTQSTKPLPKHDQFETKIKHHYVAEVLNQKHFELLRQSLPSWSGFTLIVDVDVFNTSLF